MSVTIQINNIIARINKGRWFSTTVGMVRVLSIYNRKRVTEYTPWPDYTIAQMAAKALGGEIIKATNPPEYVAGRVY